MRITVIWSFLSLVALATGGLVAGCDSDAKIARSSPGESCTKTSDCNDGLKCLNGTCYSPSAIIDKSDGGESNSGGGGGPTVVPPIPPNLGGPGESCTKRADCEDGLACLSQRCSEDGGGEGGSGSGSGPELGGPGETCGLSSDCAEGLTCLPTDIFIDSYGSKVKASGSNSVGVCSVLDSGIAPTGNSCYECVEAADCCELPLLEQDATGAKSCTELAALVDAVADCATTTVALDSRVCLDFSVYCTGECANNTWACDAGSCRYTAKCSKAGVVVGGCPAVTRLGRTVSPCNTDTKTCVPAACKKDVDCDGGDVPVFDDPTQLCLDDECTCHVDSGHCYRKCSEDLDCAGGFACDTATNVCVRLPSCTSDAQCAVRTGDIRNKCVDGECARTCEHDVECSGGSLHGGFSGVCGPDKVCVSVGCSDDTECTEGNFEGLLR